MFAADYALLGLGSSENTTLMQRSTAAEIETIQPPIGRVVVAFVTLGLTPGDAEQSWALQRSCSLGQGYED